MQIGRVSFVAVIISLIFAAMGTGAAAPASHPNVLLIVADDLGYSDIGCFGGEIRTPNLDALAKDGVRFTQFYNAGRCCPSRATIMTGLFSHQVGLGHMINDLGLAGYRGKLSENCTTLAEVLRDAGYRTLMAGKWHLGTGDPTKRGFEEFFGTLSSAASFWDPSKYVRLPEGRPRRAYEAGHFYGTDALTDQAMDFLGSARQTAGKPWFLYLAYNSPHFPIQAPKEEIAKYADVYKAGWDEIRQRRYERMKSMGLIDARWPLSPRSEYTGYAGKGHGVNPAWDSLDQDRRADLAQRMAVFAGMVDRMDQNIGRIVEDLRKNRELDNTLILFLSDNGACAEWDPFGFDGKSGPDNVLHRGDDLEKMGGPGTYHSVGSAWANASNTPWRLYKHYAHEGGISTPLIAHWPAGTDRKGEIDRRPGHIIDLMPTLLDVSGASYPATVRGNAIPPIEGKSLAAAIRGEPAAGERTLYFEHEGNRAVRRGNWKLVAVKAGPWQLYDVDADRVEMHDLAATRADLAAQLADEWQKWAARCQVTPAPAEFPVRSAPAKAKAKE